MSSIQRLNGSSPQPLSLDTSPVASAPPPRVTESSPASPPLANLFKADRFGASADGAGGAQEVLQKLEALIQAVGQFAQRLGIPDSQGASASASGGVQAVGGPEGKKGASFLQDVPQEAQVPELGNGAPGHWVAPAQAAADAGGTTDAKAFLAKGPHPKDRVYEEIAHESPGLGDKNKALWDAAHAAGASDAEAAVLVAQQMQEGANDSTKSGGAENFGPLNLNRGLLKDFGGVKEEGLSQLNENAGGKYTHGALRANAGAALTAMRTMGTERYLDHVRGGSSAYDNPTARLPFAGPATADDDTRRFGRNIANAANKVLSDFQKDPQSLTRDWRQAASIPYV
jgi:hypothetical protein